MNPRMSGVRDFSESMAEVKRAFEHIQRVRAEMSPEMRVADAMADGTIAADLAYKEYVKNAAVALDDAMKTW